MTEIKIKESNYDQLMKALEEILSWIVYIADEYYGTPQKIMKIDDIDTLWTLQEREIFFKSALETLNALSLKEALKRGDQN